MNVPASPQARSSEPTGQLIDGGGVANFDTPSSGAAQVRAKPSGVQGLPSGVHLLVVADPAPAELSPQQSGQLGGNVQPLSSPIDVQLRAVDTQSGATQPLPTTVAEETFEVRLPALTQPAGAEAAWLMEVRQDGQFLGYMRFDSQFDPATNQVVFDLNGSQLDGTLFLPVVLNEEWLANFDPDVHIWSSPRNDAVDFGTAAPQWTRTRVLGPQVAGRIFVLNEFTGEPGWIEAAGVGTVPSPGHSDPPL